MDLVTLDVSAPSNCAVPYVSVNDVISLIAEALKVIDRVFLLLLHFWLRIYG